MRILGIETSCDETSAAVVIRATTGAVGVLANVVRTQVDLHADYGGVVPELASRAHILNVAPVVEHALAEAGMTPRQLDGVAVTRGPGLVGGLLVGVALAKGIALAHALPLIGVHHMEGHLLSPFLLPEGADRPTFPFVALLVSGGHTQLVLAQKPGAYRLLGTTLDDAVGEAFDKGAKMLGLGYPGGPAIAKAALGGDPRGHDFPRAIPERERLAFSFSGLKTSLRTLLVSTPPESLPPQRLSDLAAAYQEAIVEVLVAKSLAACRQTGCGRLLVAGGVGANLRLREVLGERAGVVGVKLHFPPLALCTDNGAMIAHAGLLRLEAGERSEWGFNAVPRWPLEALSPLA